MVGYVLFSRLNYTILSIRAYILGKWKTHIQFARIVSSRYSNGTEIYLFGFNIPILYIFQYANWHFVNKQYQRPNVTRLVLCIIPLGTNFELVTIRDLTMLHGTLSLYVTVPDMYDVWL